MRRPAGMVLSVLTALSLLGPISPLHAQAAPSPNGQIVYIAEANDHQAVMIMNPDGSDAHALTQGDVNPLSVSVSLDGSKIAFVDRTSFDVYVINADGSDQRRLTRNRSANNPNVVGWLPDSSAALFLTDERALPEDFNLTGSGSARRLEVFVAPINGAAAHVIGKISLATEFIGNWSPDGRWLIVGGTEPPVKNQTGRFNYPRATYLAAVDGTNQKLLPSVGAAAFSPDGSQIAFIDPSMQLWLLPVDLSRSPVAVGEAREIWGNAGSNPNLSVSSLAWSPDGTRIAMQVWTGQDDGGGPGFVYSVNADGSDLQRLVPTGSANGSLAWFNPGGAAVAAPVATATEAVLEFTADSMTATPDEPDLLLGCTVIANGTANLREGAGTNFARVGTMSAGQMSSVSGQATGADGHVWWQLVEGGWVRSDLVQTATDCSTVPVVTP